MEVLGAALEEVQGGCSQSHFITDYQLVVGMGKLSEIYMRVLGGWSDGTGWPW